MDYRHRNQFFTYEGCPFSSVTDYTREFLNAAQALGQGVNRSCAGKLCQSLFQNQGLPQEFELIAKKAVALRLRRLGRSSELDMWWSLLRRETQVLVGQLLSTRPVRTRRAEIRTIPGAVPLAPPQCPWGPPSDLPDPPLPLFSAESRPEVAGAQNGQVEKKIIAQRRRVKRSRRPSPNSFFTPCGLFPTPSAMAQALVEQDLSWGTVVELARILNCARRRARHRIPLENNLRGPLVDLLYEMFRERPERVFLRWVAILTQEFPPSPDTPDYLLVELPRVSAKKRSKVAV